MSFFISFLLTGLALSQSLLAYEESDLRLVHPIPIAPIVVHPTRTRKVSLPLNHRTGNGKGLILE